MKAAIFLYMIPLGLQIIGYMINPSMPEEKAVEYLP
jgi:hypothetical protein